MQNDNNTGEVQPKPLEVYPKSTSDPTATNQEQTHSFHNQPDSTPATHTPNPNPPGRPPVPTNSRHDAIEKAEQITMFTYFGIAALLLFRFVLSLFGASRTTPFVDFVFQLTTPFMVPFDSAFGTPKGSGDYILDFNVLLALLVYGLIFFGIARLIKIIFK